MNLKKVITMVTIVGVLGVVGVAYAATTKTPAEIAAGLTGKTVEVLAKERATGKTYGEIAQDAGKREEFKTQVLAEKKALLDERVKAGSLTQKQADEIYQAIKDNQTNCDGTGNAGIGKRAGMGFGQGCGLGQGQGRGQGQGCQGQGMGNCLVQ